MKSVRARITSKNQLTLPATLVRKYRLDINRNVTITEKNGALVLKPEPTLAEVLTTARKRLPRVKPLPSDEEFQHIKHQAWDQKDL